MTTVVLLGPCRIPPQSRAIAACSACGFKKEAVLKRFLFVDGAWVDLVLMAVFRPARKRARGTNLKRLGATHQPPIDAAAARDKTGCRPINHDAIGENVPSPGDGYSAEFCAVLPSMFALCALYSF